MQSFIHILGMGNLTPVQTSKLVSVFKNYMTYRSDIKSISMSSPKSIPNIPTTAEYKLSVLGNYKLKSKRLTDEYSISAITPESVVEPVKAEVVAETRDIQYLVKDSIEYIKYYPENVERLIQMFRVLDLSAAKAKNLRNKLQIITGRSSIVTTKCALAIISTKESGEDGNLITFMNNDIGNATKSKLLSYLKVF